MRSVMSEWVNEYINTRKTDDAYVRVYSLCVLMCAFMSHKQKQSSSLLSRFLITAQLSERANI